MAFAAAAVDRQVAERIATARWAVKAVSGRGMIVVLLALGASTILVPLAALRLAFPDVHPAVSLGVCSMGVAAFIVGAARLGDQRWARIVAVLVPIAIIAGIGALTRSAHGRRTVVSHGLLSKTILRALSRSPLSDRDGDGYGGPFLGGADCDDAREDLNPGAVDIAGNGIDENCSGGDADPTWVSERFKPRTATSRAERRYNVLMVSIDALRADHVGAWGYSRATTPALDRFAAGATRFSWAFTSAPKTLPAIASLLTGRHPSSLVWQGGNRLLMDESRAKGLAETMLQAGYDTAAITCCARFAQAENELTGFAHLDAAAAEELDRLPGRANSAFVVEKAIRWVDRRAARAAPYFLWIHLFDPHAPHNLPEGAAEFGDGRMDQYDSEIAFADLNLGRLLAAFDERGLASTTIVVVAADHGEEFDEHGHRFHSSGLFNHLARIPLMVRYPAASPHVVSTPVSIVDVMPTILDLVGVPGPAGMNGRSLAAAVLGRGDAPARPVVMEISHRVGMDRDMVAVASGPWKVIWDREANAWSLFSANDPDERTDLALSEPDRLETMRRQLFETMDREFSIAPRRPIAR